jgi:hypothetical protein
VVGQTVTVTLNGKTYSGIVQSDGTWSIAVGNADLAALTNGTAYTVASTITDLAGNKATATDKLTVDEPATLAITQCRFTADTLSSNGGHPCS